MSLIKRESIRGAKNALRMLPTKNWRISLLLLGNIFSRIIFQNSKKKDSDLLKKRHILISGWIQKNLKSEIEQELKKLAKNKLLYNQLSSKIEMENYPIWVLWWQGEDTMPDTVKKCYHRLQKNKNVNLINKNNLCNYIDLPKELFNKFNDKKIPIQTISDIIRLKLLYEYGGLWIDSTMFLVGDIPELSGFDFFSLKQITHDNKYVSKYRWDTSFLFAHKNLPYFNFLINVHLVYSLKYDFNIDYFLIDYLIDLLSKYDEEFNSLINHIPYSNPDTSLFSNIANNEYDDRIMKSLTLQNFVFKLNHRIKYLSRTDEGKKTNWSSIMD